MTIIKQTTKKGQNMLNSAMSYEGFYLSEVYGNYSRAKENAWQWCIEQCEKENGFGFHIFSHNTFGFSVAWETAEGLRIETPQNSYLVK